MAVDSLIVGALFIPESPPEWVRLLAGLVILIVVGASYLGLARSGSLGALNDAGSLRSLVLETGMLGPVVIVGLVALAVVVTPIPSGHIAIVSGAVFGSLWGSLYVVAGAEIGALLAFSIARFLGQGLIRRWPRAQRMLDRWGAEKSQTWLSIAVLLSRLIPFISFDAVSYVAGLTPLRLWRFAVATLIGSIPVSFALASFGEELLHMPQAWLPFAALAAGTITLVPLILAIVRPPRHAQPKKPR